MKPTHWLFLTGVIAVFAALVKIPFQDLFPGETEETGLLLKRLINGLLILIFGLGLIARLGLKKQNYLHILAVRNPKALLPVALLFLAYLLLTRGSFLKAQVGVGFFLFILITVFIKTASEEIIFRGVFQSWFIKKGYTPGQSILSASILFSLLHALNIFSHGDWATMVTQMIFAFFMGLLLGSVNIISGNILVCCMLHCMVNLPAAMKKFAIPEPAVAENILPSSVGEDILSILLFCLLYSPLIGFALYYFRHPKTRQG